MNTQFRLQCTNCKEVFKTADSTVAHAVPEECSEWENHQMYEVHFRIYTDEMEARDQADWARYQRYHAEEADRTAQLEEVRKTGHFEWTDEDALLAHLIEDHGYGRGAHVWAYDARRDMHEHAHETLITAEWYKNDRAAHGD